MQRHPGPKLVQSNALTGQNGNQTSPGLGAHVAEPFRKSTVQCSTELVGLQRAAGFNGLWDFMCSWNDHNSMKSTTACHIAQTLRLGHISAALLLSEKRSSFFSCAGYEPKALSLWVLIVTLSHERRGV